MTLKLNYFYHGNVISTLSPINTFWPHTLNLTQMKSMGWCEGRIGKHVQEIKVGCLEIIRVQGLILSEQVLTFIEVKTSNTSF